MELTDEQKQRIAKHANDHDIDLCPACGGGTFTILDDVIFLQLPAEYPTAGLMCLKCKHVMLFSVAEILI
jgi:hypothetical protein